MSFPSARQAWTTTLAPLRRPLFRAFWTASMASNLGSYVQSVGAAWLMTSIAPSASFVALVNSATTLPILLLALVAGAVADVYDRRLVMIGSQGVMLCASVALAVMAYVGVMSPWLLLGMTALIGCGTAMNAPAWQASVGEQVPREDLAGAVALNSLQANVARSLGPAIGGVVVAVAGASAAFLLNALSYLGLIAVLIGWKRDQGVRTLPPERLHAAMGAGVQYVRHSPIIRPTLSRALLFGVTASAIWALMPLLAKDGLGQGASGYGLLLAAFGLGSVLGALSNTVLRQRFGDELVVRAGTVGFALSVALAGGTLGLPPTLAALLVTGFCWVVVVATLNINVQLAAPKWVVGRAMSLFQMATFGGMAIGSWAYGAIAEAQGVGVSLWVSAAAVFLTLAFAGRWRLKPIPPTGFDLDTFRPTVTPSVAASVVIGADPMVLSVEYRISETNTPLFLKLMLQKSEVRRRNGARRWRLLQDVADPELWMERFESASWTEHIRQRHRMTRADLEIEARIRELHEGLAPPVVRRLMQRTPVSGGVAVAIADPTTPQSMPS